MRVMSVLGAAVMAVGLGVLAHADTLFAMTPDQLIRALNADGGVRVKTFEEVRSPGDIQFEGSVFFRFGQCIDAFASFDSQSNRITTIELQPTADDHAGCTIQIGSPDEREMISDSTARIVRVLSSVHDRTKIFNQMQELKGRLKALTLLPGAATNLAKMGLGAPRTANLNIGGVWVSLTETLNGTRYEYGISAD
jgi:hypothetical protein